MGCVGGRLVGGRVREVKIDHDREWLVLVVTRRRSGKPDRISRLYLSLDEAAIAVELLKRELPEVTRSNVRDAGPT